MFFPLSVALIIGSVGFVCIVSPVEMVLMVGLVLTLEEREAERKFSDAYRSYRKQVPAFNLRLFCLRQLFHAMDQARFPPTN